MSGGFLFFFSKTSARIREVLERQLMLKTYKERNTQLDAKILCVYKHTYGTPDRPWC